MFIYYLTLYYIISIIAIALSYFLYVCLKNIDMKKAHTKYLNLIISLEKYT